MAKKVANKTGGAKKPARVPSGKDTKAVPGKAPPKPPRLPPAKPTAKAAARTAEKSAAKPAEKSVAKPSAKARPKPAKAPLEKPAAKPPAEAPVPPPPSEPVKAPVEQPAAELPSNHHAAAEAAIAEPTWVVWQDGRGVWVGTVDEYKRSKRPETIVCDVFDRGSRRDLAALHRAVQLGQMLRQSYINAMRPWLKYDDVAQGQRIRHWDERLVLSNLKQ
jgi:hypothetical protein